MRLVEEGDDLIGGHVLDQATQNDAAAGVGHRHVEVGQDLEPRHVGKQVLQGHGLEHRPGAAAVQ